MVKKTKKRKTSKKKGFSKSILNTSKLKTGKLLLYSSIVFLVSLVLYGASNTAALIGLFGLTTILSGSLILLGITVELVLFLLQKKK